MLTRLTVRNFKRFEEVEEVRGNPDQEFAHPTLGQYKNRRIPVPAPIMPARFVGFILRNYYTYYLT